MTRNKHDLKKKKKKMKLSQYSESLPTNKIKPEIFYTLTEWFISIRNPMVSENLRNICRYLRLTVKKKKKII